MLSWQDSQFPHNNRSTILPWRWIWQTVYSMVQKPFFKDQTGTGEEQEIGLRRCFTLHNCRWLILWKNVRQPYTPKIAINWNFGNKLFFCTNWWLFRRRNKSAKIFFTQTLSTILGFYWTLYLKDFTGIKMSPAFKLGDKAVEHELRLIIAYLLIDNINRGSLNVPIMLIADIQIAKSLNRCEI